MIDKAWEQLLRELGYDINGPHFKGTPARVARFMSEWHTMKSEPPPVTTFPSDTDSLVVVTAIPFYSMCAHHGLPFFGTASIGYIPEGRIAGLSKFARVIDHFARRFQVQEAITEDVGHHLERVLAPRGVGVVLAAEHLCMSMRGIQRPGHQTVTSYLSGAIRDKPEARAEFLALARKESR